MAPVLVLAVAVWVATAAGVWGQDAGAPDIWSRSRAARLAAAETRVMAGDLRRLVDEPALSEARRQGLRDRLVGAASSLPLLLREAGLPPDALAAAALRAAASNGDDAGLSAMLTALTERLPLDLTGILPADRRPRALALARVLHEDLCAGCHDGGPADADAPLPAEDLFVAARTMPVEEFAARLLGGVRGDHLTAFAQPLGDTDLSALIGYYTPE